MKTQKIHLLSMLDAQHIAAGEVIERPANIVKELIENSIDAGAGVITIYIEKAGKQRIEISDNGCGMSRLDAELCFARHATSKLKSALDLMAIATFGFRGEALASIASAGIVTLTTKEQDEPLLGTKITYRHGVHESTTETACPAGTTIVLTDLFGAVPARKAFLKQDETEWNQIQSVVQGIALTRLNIHFYLYKDGQLCFNASAAATLKDRVTQLFGSSLAQQLTPVSSENKGITVTGLTSLPPYARYGKELIILWINNRLIKNSDIIRAVTKGYLQALPAGKYPAAFLSIQADPQTVDVNIHPRKEEVRFTRPGIMQDCVQEAVHQALSGAVSSRLGGGFKPEIPAPSFFTQPPSALPSYLPFTQRPMLSSMPTTALNWQPTSLPLLQTPSLPTELPFAGLGPQDAEQKNEDLQAPATIIGQLFNTYILIEQNNELVIVDQHAAHERILYNRFINTFTKKEGTTLLFPETVHLHSPTDVQILIEIQDFFQDQGIAFEQAGPQQLRVTSLPPHMKNAEALQTVLQDAADFGRQQATLDTTLFRQKLNEHVQSHLACKLAVRAGDSLSRQEMMTLVDQLMTTPDRFMCIHGRPTLWPISLAELEKRFKRRS